MPSSLVDIRTQTSPDFSHQTKCSSGVRFQQFFSFNIKCNFVLANNVVHLLIPMIYFFLRVKLLNFLVYLFFSLKFFNTQNLVKTVAFGIKTQCKVFLIQTCRFGFPEIRLSLASKLAFTHCLKFSSFKDVSSDFEFFFP